MKQRSICASVFLFLITFFSSAARADNWGCEVLLCLSNPSGPTAVSQCEPPIKKLYSVLSQKPPGDFPKCDMAKNKQSGNSWAEQSNNWFNECPAGTKQIERNELAIQGDANTLSGMQPIDLGKAVSGLDETTSSSEMPVGSNTTLKVCGNTLLGTVKVTSRQDDAVYSTDVNVYKQIVFIDRAKSPRLINVYINDQLYRQVRW
jgi:hypothetical protein